jgi:hypothetical protein
VKTLLLLAALAVSADAQRIVYTKVFPGSNPAYVKITVDAQGAATYQEAADEPEPVRFTLEPAVTQTLFHLAAKLGHFTRKLDSNNTKVANMGLKTYRWEEGGNATIVQYNHTTDEDARAFQDWFERITECQRILAELEHTYRYDRLGVNDVLVRLEAVWQQKRVVGAAQFIPMLDRVARNAALLNMARDRAAALSEAFQAATKAVP